MKVFIDADVLFSASYSIRGASYAIFSSKAIELFTSNKCMEEAIRALEKYEKELNLSLLAKSTIVDVTKEEGAKYKSYVIDLTDSHVVAGAAKSGANILTSHNIRDFREALISKDFGISVMKPGEVLFYIRNILL